MIPRSIVIEDEQISVIEVGVQGPPGVNGNTDYIRSTPTSITVGGAAAGTTFDGVIQDALDKILYPYIQPTFSSFSLGGYNILEVGDSIPAGNITFNWGTTTSDNIEVDSISIANVTDAETYATGLANDGTETISLSSDITKNLALPTVFRISALDTQGSSLLRDYTVNWYWRIWYGESTDPSLDTEVEIEALRTSVLAGSSSRTYDFLAGGYKWLAYPTAMGLKTNFTDVNTGFPVAMEVPITVSITNSYGVTTNYYVHRTYNILGGSIQIAVS